MRQLCNSSVEVRGKPFHLRKAAPPLNSGGVSGKSNLGGEKGGQYRWSFFQTDLYNANVICPTHSRKAQQGRVHPKPKATKLNGIRANCFATSSVRPITTKSGSPGINITTQMGVGFRNLGDSTINLQFGLMVGFLLIFWFFSF